MYNERFEKFFVFLRVRNFKEDASVNKRRKKQAHGRVVKGG